MLPPPPYGYMIYVIGDDDAKMGIRDAKHALETWLLSLIPQAFFYALPDLFFPHLIVQDMTAAEVSAFNAKRVLSGDDYIRHLARPIEDFGNAPMGVNEANAPIDLTQYRSESAPDALTLRADTETTIPRVGLRPLFVYARDNSAHMPQPRRMVHDERYATVAVNAAKNGDDDDEDAAALQATDMPFTLDEIRAQTLHVRKGRPMPGIKSLDSENLPDGAMDVRRRALRTPELRNAYQQYGAWELAREIKAHGDPEEKTTKMAPEDERFVLIDMVPSQFPEKEYLHGEIADLPDEWAAGPCHAELVELRSGRRRGQVETLALGEADLKLAWYTEHLSRAGDHVLLRCNDSDMLFLLLLHADRWLESGRVVFLDMMPQADTRMKHRFICITELMRGLNDVAKTRWNGISNVSAVLAFLALTCGSDYTRSHYYIAAPAIIKAFDEQGGWRTLHTLFAHLADIATPSENLGIWAEHLPNHADGGILWPSLPMLNESVADDFLRMLYQTRLGQAYIVKEYKVPANTRLSWHQVDAYSQKRWATAKTSSKYAVPSALDRSAEIRRIYWYILYWSNAHLGMGLFPNAITILPENSASVWGWDQCPKMVTGGSGLTRARLVDVDNAVRENSNNATIADVYGRFMEGWAKAVLQPWLVCHTNYVAGYECIWNVLVSEWIFNVANKG